MNKVKELSWSLSKNKMFEQCPRRYYYHYHFAPQAKYCSDASEDLRLAGEMRCIKSLDMWVGEIVHGAIQWTLELINCGKAPSEKDIRSEVKRRLSEGWKASKNRLWRTCQEDIYPNLFEHYYKIPVNESTINRLKDKAYTSTSNFIKSDVFNHIGNAPQDRWLPIERYAAFRLKELLMYVKFDFAMREGKQLVVYDWKTGKPSEDTIHQLMCYAAYTADKWQVPYENVKVCAVHLYPELELIEQPVTLEGIDKLYTYVKRGFDAMIKCLRDPQRNIAVMEDFPMTENLLHCAYCNFKGICSQGKQINDYSDIEIEIWEEE
jgi:hypothetical protein